MGLISRIKFYLSICNEEYYSEEITYRNSNSYNNLSVIVDFVLHMAEISQHWSLPITITIESNP